ncbi:MAG: FUSC family protein [Opitutaceae bacterium]|nr:FUSC family protein [Opitutaceae bacterium]
MNALIARWRDYVEEKRLQPDLSRAARCTAGFMGPVIAALWWELPVEATYAAMGAQVIALVDVRGSYPLRLSLLLAMTAVLAGAAWLGSAAGVGLGSALGATLLLMLVSGLARHLSPEYGAALANGSGLIFLIALAHPGGHLLADRHFLATLGGGAWGLLIQIGLWPFRAQHPLRRAVAESWLALSDLVASITPEDRPGTGDRHLKLAEQQAALRAALDHATAQLATATASRSRPYLRQLEELNLAAARLGTRLLAFNASLETVMERRDFAALAPSFSPVFTSLTNTTRTIALTVVSRQPSHLATGEVRLRRLGHLLQALQDRLQAQLGRAPDGVQLNFLLAQINGLLPGVHRTLRASVDRADEHAAFSLELFDLQTWTLRPLASSLDFHWRPDPALLRFVARSTVVQLIGVGLFMLFGVERGYWLPLTTLVVLQPEYGATRLRAGQRVLGTLAGSLLASLVLWLAPPPPVLLAIMALTMAGFGFWLKRNYAIAVFFITLFVVVLTEMSAPVTVDFTLRRMAATAAGGLLALLAAQLFWPVWERSRFPALLAAALRANRDLLRVLGERLHAGGGYDAGAVAHKRAAEVANSTVFASLQRMMAEPKNQQAGLEEAAALANGNQRLTRALTVVALHLTTGAALLRPEYAHFVRLAGEALEALAAVAEGATQSAAALARLRTALDEIAFPLPPPGASALEHSASTQFARCATELSAMLLEARGTQAVTAPPFPTAASA